MQPERMMGKGLVMEAMEGRNIWRVARTVFFGNLLTGVVSNLVFVVFFSRLGGWDGMFGFFSDDPAAVEPARCLGGRCGCGLGGAADG